MGLQRQAAVDQTTLPVQNFNQNIIQLTREQMLREMFDKYDTDKDGFLDSGSYREFLKGISVWGNGQYNDDDWEFKWPEECALLKVLLARTVSARPPACAALTFGGVRLSAR
eukprot:SAG31_NODE_366_length_16817_cov_17.317921_2_plen_112_part_00